MNHDYYHISAGELGKDAGLPIRRIAEVEAAFRELADEMTAEIEENNRNQRRTVFICPVGPVGQYPFFVRQVNDRGLSLKNCWFFNMDEYLDDSGSWLDQNHRLSFRGFMNREVYGKIRPELLMPEEQRIFPDPADPEKSDRLLEELGGADICFGGIGITGHLAFNEPLPGMKPEEFAGLPTRVVDISPETRTANAIGDLGGALEEMPQRAVTIGMKQILGARRLRLLVFRDWHRAVCRRTAYGEMTAAFPATLARKHPDACLLVSGAALELPY